jgi:hypothetical protein
VGISTRFDLSLDVGYTVVILSNYESPIALRLGQLLYERLTE